MSLHDRLCTLPKGFGDCICDELRQAEERVRMETQLECRLTPDDWRDAVEQAREQGQRDALAAVNEAENLAYERGVKAGYTARQDAVAVVDILRDALAAIDALEKP